jgi:hypothetical protein
MMALDELRKHILGRKNEYELEKKKHDEDQSIEEPDQK